MCSILKRLVDALTCPRRLRQVKVLQGDDRRVLWRVHFYGASRTQKITTVVGNELQSVHTHAAQYMQQITINCTEVFQLICQTPKHCSRMIAVNSQKVDGTSNSQSGTTGMMGCAVESSTWSTAHTRIYRTRANSVTPNSDDES